MKTNTKIALSVLLFAAVGALAATTLLAKKERVATSNTPEKPLFWVETGSFSQVTLQKSQTFLATLQPTKRVTISSIASGHIESFLVHEAEHVKKDQLLLRIDASVLEAELETLRATLLAHNAELEIAKNALARDKALYAKGGIAKERLEQSGAMLLAQEAKANATRNKIKALGTQQNYYIMRAPFDGEIGTVFTHGGDLAMPNKPLLQLNSHTMKLTFAFTDHHVAKGRKVLLEDREIGTINTVYADAENGLKIAEVQLSAALPYKSGESLSVEVVLGEYSGCAVPARAILQSEGNTYILLQHDKRFTKEAVEIVAQDAQNVILKACHENKVALGSPNRLVTLAGMGAFDANE
jgi:RND family efflux transporter MFP subunit